MTNHVHLPVTPEREDSLPRTMQSLAHVPAKWHPVRRQEHAPTVESTAFSVHMGSLCDPI
jgi:REP element-mobilizing transposase RayT